VISCFFKICSIKFNLYRYNMRREMREWKTPQPTFSSSSSSSASAASPAAVATAAAAAARVAREECGRISKAMDRIQRRVETLERTAEGDARRYNEHGVPWWGSAR
jgi:hypothetical protein